jgi:class 3 adenylate cyclase
MIVDVDYPTRGTYQTVGMPMKLSDSPAEVTRPPPLGEQTAECSRRCVVRARTRCGRARGAAVAETGSGDSVLIAHDDPVALAQTARHIMDDVYQATGQPLLRVALHYGEVQMQMGAGDAPPMVVGGDAVLCASRVEPHVLPGQIWATEEFRQQLAQKPSLWRTTEMMSPDGGDRFNVKKEARAEPDLWVRLYRLEF